MITREEILKGRDKEFPLDETLEKNLSNLLIALNKFRKAFNKPMKCTSGYRPASINASIGGSKKSAHMSCQAADFADPDGKLKEFCLKNIKLLEECGLWLESPDHTKGWIHLDTRQRKNRVFIP